jgi:hypothetical protein
MPCSISGLEWQWRWTVCNNTNHYIQIQVTIMTTGKKNCSNNNQLDLVPERPAVAAQVQRHRQGVIGEKCHQWQMDKCRGDNQRFIDNP